MKENETIVQVPSCELLNLKNLKSIAMCNNERQILSF